MQKKRITNCILLTITGNSMAYMNNFNILKNKKNKLENLLEFIKLKKKCLKKLRALNFFNLSNFTYSIHCSYMLFIPFHPKKIKFFEKNNTIYYKNQNRDQFNQQYINIRQYIRKNKYSTIKLIDNPILNIKDLLPPKYIPIKSHKNKYIQKTPNDFILSPKNNTIPTNIIYLSGITLGIVFNDPKTYPIRDAYIIHILVTRDNTINRIRNHSYMAIILISTLIASIIHNSNIIDALVLTNKYLQKCSYLKIYSKYEQSIKNQFNTFIQEIISIKKNNIKVILESTIPCLNDSNYIIPDYDIDDIIVAIRAVLRCDHSWDNVVYWSGFSHNSGIFSCSLACGLYGLANDSTILKKIPEEQYLNIENYDLHIKFIKKLLKNL